MICGARFAISVLIGLLAGNATVFAAQRSVSRSDWLIEGNRVTLRFSLPQDAARRIVDNGTTPSTEQVAAYVLDHLSVSAADTVCPAIDQGYDIGRIDTLSVGSDSYGFEVIFSCPRSQSLTLRDSVLFERVPQHLNFARIDDHGHTVTQIFTAGRQELRTEAGEQASAGFFDFFRIGSSHILYGVDRLCFLAGMLALVRGRRDLIGMAVGALAGYAASVLVAAGGHLIPNMNGVESALGFLVAFVAVQIIAREIGDSRRLAAVVGAVLLIAGASLLVWRGTRMAWLPLGLGIFAVSFQQIAFQLRQLPLSILPAAFGFLDGAVLPGDYARLQLWHEARAADLAAFNAGALLMCAILLTVFWLALRAVRQRKFSLPGALVKDFLATALAGAGTFWMITRLCLI
jgi:hypothetical protein